MAVQKSKKSRSRRNMRRSHDALTSTALSIEQGSGEVHRRHHICPKGYYRGQEVMKIKQPQEPAQDD